MTMIIQRLREHSAKGGRFIGVLSGPQQEDLQRHVETAKVFRIEDFQDSRHLGYSILEKSSNKDLICKLPFETVVIETKENGQRWCWLLWRDLMNDGELYLAFFRTKQDNSPIELFIVCHIKPATLEVDKDGNSSIEMATAIAGLVTESSDVWVVPMIISALSFLAIINSPRIIDVEDPDLTKINRKRIANGKIPLLEYSIIRLKSHILRTTREELQTGRVRQHWVRGHLKVRKTGVFWWNEHLAGNPEHGKVEGLYLLEKENKNDHLPK